MDTESITIEEAYMAMFYFLEHEYEITKEDYLGGLLGELNNKMWQDGKPADPASWNDWITAVQKAIRH